MTALPNPFISESAPVGTATHNSGEGDPSVMPDYAGAGTDNDPRCNCGHLFEICNHPFCPRGVEDDHRFVLDVEAFEAAIEPAPLFLQRGRA